MSGLDFGFGALEAEFWRFVFVMTRIGAAVMAAPLFGTVSVAPQLRVVLTGAVAVLVCAWTDVAAPAQMMSVPGLLAVMGEVLIGLTMGFVLQLFFAAPVVAAEVIGAGMAMNMAVTVDPAAGTQSPALGQYFMVVLTIVFLASGAHLQWFSLIVRSYEVFAPGQTWLGAERFALIASFGTQMFLTGVAIALPVTLVLLVVQVVTGVLSRSAPALNLFALGLPAGILGGLAALIISAPLLTDMVSALSAEAITHVMQVLQR